MTTLRQRMLDDLRISDAGSRPLKGKGIYPHEWRSRVQVGVSVIL
jgi:hypothetical protein